MTRSLIITSINPPTDTVVKTRKLRPDWRICVVGDRKSPAEWFHEGVDFLSLDAQLELPFELARKLPVGHYSRKNLGYLVAMQQGAEVIAETDDDNFPYETFLGDISPRLTARPIEERGWVNVYRAYTDARVWPRGFPLEEVRASMAQAPRLGEAREAECHVQQFLADGDPDVDAVYRLVLEGEVLFQRDLDVVLPPEAHCPFNSQNTVWFPAAYPLLYLPSTVSFRMTDIWRSFVTARCLAAAGMSLAFRGPTVYQDRNEHNLIRDFEAEIDGYLRNTDIVDQLSAVNLDGLDMGAALRRCYVELLGMGLVADEELVLVDLWLDAVRELSGV
ncbi:MAG: STELLO glycosyltransferase family protein [Acidimicrobiales bacterium]|nr:STELLO glycosyltransferase family protein [Acidimicrobiales bacterium]